MRTGRIHSARVMNWCCDSLCTFSRQSDFTEAEEHVQVAHKSHCVELSYTVVVVESLPAETSLSQPSWRRLGGERLEDRSSNHRHCLCRCADSSKWCFPFIAFTFKNVSWHHSITVVHTQIRRVGCGTSRTAHASFSTSGTRVAWIPYASIPVKILCWRHRAIIQHIFGALQWPNHC